MKSYLFSFVSVALEEWPKENITRICVRECFAWCSLLTVFWCHVFYLNHYPFGVDFCAWYEGVFQLHWLTGGCPASPIPLVEGTVFSLVYSCLLCQRLIDYGCVRLQCLCPVPLINLCVSSMLFWLLSLGSVVWSLWSCVLCAHDCFGNCGSSLVPMCILGLFVLFLWKMSWILWQG